MGNPQGTSVTFLTLGVSKESKIVDSNAEAVRVTLAEVHGVVKAWSRTSVF